MFLKDLEPPTLQDKAKKSKSKILQQYNKTKVCYAFFNKSKRKAIRGA